MQRVFLSLLLLLGSMPCSAEPYDRLGEIVPADIGRALYAVAVVDDVAFVLYGSGGVENLFAFDISGTEPGGDFTTITDAFWQNVMMTPRGMIRHEDALYVFTIPGLQVVDVSDPRAPVVAEAIFVGDRQSNGIVDGDTLFTIGQSVLAVFDVTVPTQPELTASHEFVAEPAGSGKAYDGGRYPYGIAHRNGYLYLGWLDAEDDSDNRLLVYRLDTDGPVDDGAVEDGLEPGEVLEKFAVVGDLLVGCSRAGVSLWSLENPRRPAVLDRAEGNGRNCVVEGDHVILNGPVYRIVDDSFVPIATIDVDVEPIASFPHHGDVAAGRVALAQGNRILLTEAPSGAFLHAGGLSGLWIDFSAVGDGFNVIRSGEATTILFFGYGVDGEQLWLISETLSGPLRRESPVTLAMFEATGGTFASPTVPDGLLSWGTLEISFTDCAQGNAVLDGMDGRKEMALMRLAQIDDSRCD